ncbi:MAG TPA: AI-2E family transporter [Candidatus Binatia bacterium]|nr:AI-2E family transporter [Candidatus Binatia bacterium]
MPSPSMPRILDPRTLRVVWTVLVVIGALALVYLLRTVLVVLAFSVVFAYLIFPLVKLVERFLPRRTRRPLAIGVIYLVLVAALSTLVALVGPPLGRELAALGQKFPEMSEQIKSGRVISNIFPRWGGAEILDDMVRAHLPQVVEYAQRGLTGALGWLAGAWVVVMIPIFAFFFLRDAEWIAEAVTGAITERGGQRKLSETIAQDLHTVLGEYVRALVLLCALTFVVWTILFLVAGVPYALVLAAIGGALEFLPVVGPLAAGVTIVAVALFSGFGHAWLLAVFILIWRLVQDYVSSPLIMGRGVELHPGLVIFGVLAGGELAGVAGMFLSVPVIAGLKVVWRRLRDFRADS